MSDTELVNYKAAWVEIKKFIQAKENLLTAHRLGSHRRAEKAIDELNKLGSVVDIENRHGIEATP